MATQILPTWRQSKFGFRRGIAKTHEDVAVILDAYRDRRWNVVLPTLNAGCRLDQSTFLQQNRLPMHWQRSILGRAVCRSGPGPMIIFFFYISP